MTDETLSPDPPKKKRVMTQAQLDNLARGRAARDEKRRGAEAPSVARGVLEEGEDERGAPEASESSPESTSGAEDAGQPQSDLWAEEEDDVEEAVATDGAEIDPQTGQRLVKVERRPKPVEQVSARPPQTIEEILQRSDERKKRRRAAEADPDPEPAHGPDPAVPPDEPRPAFRSKPTMGQVELLDVPESFTARTTPRSLADLALYVDEAQNYFIQVVRTTRVLHGTPCKGAQRPIREYITDEEFTQIYGGGDYKLTLRGPPKKGGIYDHRLGRIRDVALTEPIDYTVPHHFPPNLNAALSEDDDEWEDEDEDDMRQVPGMQPRRGVASAADAKIHEANLQFQERAEERRLARERELQEQVDRIPATIAPLMDNLDRSTQRTIDLVEQNARERERLLRETYAKDKDKPPEVVAVGEMLTNFAQALRPSDSKGSSDAAELLAAAQREREHLVTVHKDELRRVNEAADRRASEAEERAEKRIRDIEERASNRIRETEERCEKQIRDARGDVDKQVRDIERTMQSRLDDERRSQERDMLTQKTVADSRVETQKVAYEMRLTAKDEEIGRLRAEADRLRAELDQVKDLPTQLQKFTATAEVMGFTRSDGKEEEEEKEPPDWKSLLGQIGLNLVSQLPDMMRTARATINDARQAQQTPQQAYYDMQAGAQGTVPARMAGAPPLRGRDGQPYRRQLAFATDEGPEFQAAVGTPPEPRYPNMPNGTMAPATPQAGPPGQVVEQQPMQPMAQPPMQQQPVMQQPVQPQAPVHQAPVPAQPVQISPEQQQQELAKLRASLEGAFSEGVEPAEVATQFVKQLGPDAVRQVMAQLGSPETIVAAVMTMPDGRTSPLVRRDGQTFVRDLWTELQRLVGG